MHKKLCEMWNYNMKGYTIPELTQDDRQFYPES